MQVARLVWNNFERWVSMFFIAFLTIILFVEVLCRYIFYMSIGWINEISGFIFVWFIYLSISYTTGKNQHIRVNILDQVIPKQYIKFVDLPMNLLWLAFNLAMAWFGVQLVLSVIEFPFTTPILDISMAIPYGIIPLAFLLSSIRLIMVIVNSIRAWEQR